MADDQLFQRAMAEEDFGKDIVALPADTVVPEGSVIFLSYRLERYGSGMFQNVMVNSLREEIRRENDGAFVLPYHYKDNGGSTDDLYRVPAEYTACLNRIIKNSNMAGWDKLPHKYIPGFFSPDNTETPKYDMELRIEIEGGETVTVPMSRNDICDNNGSDIINAVLQLMTACRAEENFVSHNETPSAETIAPTMSGAIPPMQNFWTCACGTYNNGNFCTACGASRPKI